MPAENEPRSALSLLSAGRERLDLVDLLGPQGSEQEFAEALNLIKQAEEMLRNARQSGDEGDCDDDGLALTPDDLEGLPPELLAELNVTERDRFEAFVLKAVRSSGGVMSLDKLLVAWWKESKEVVKRQAFTGKLYRMSRKRLLWTVPGRKGIYTTDREIGEGIKSF